ncbi:hypothetical protein GBAR_LOCUS31510, partial [Geodia barretti]
MFDSWHYVLFIFPQYDFLPETGTFRHCRQSQLPSPPRIRDITYASGGDMVSPTTPLSSHPCTISLQQGVLEEAKLLFERAAEESVPRSSQLARDYSALMLLGKEMEEMRWFMVPYEAHLYLTGSCPPVIRVPFEPRDYTHGDWYSSQYLNEWNKHWNPHYWEETKRERELGEDPVIIHQWQWTIYPANRSPTHKIQLQPIRDKGPGGMREKKAFASMECLYSEREAESGE